VPDTPSRSYKLVVCALDSHEKTIEPCVQDLLALYPQDHLAFATFGAASLPPQPWVTEYAASLDVEHYEAPRQAFLAGPCDFHCSEVVGMLTVARHFCANGDVAFVLHNDLRILKDFVPRFEEEMTGDWSFVAPVRKEAGLRDDYDEWCAKGGTAVLPTRVRHPQTIVAWNPKFVARVYRRKGDEEVWNDYFRRFNDHGDVALFDLSRGFFGYTGRPIFGALARHITHLRLARVDAAHRAS
jgi:hypothetical protein